MSLAILFHVLCAQHVSDINISIIRSLRLCTYATFSQINRITHLFIAVIIQLHAQNLFYNKFISCLYIFRATCAHRQEVKIVLYSIWYHHTYRWPYRASVHGTATGNLNFLDIFSEYSQTSNIKSVQWEPSCSVPANGQTDTTKLYTVLRTRLQDGQHSPSSLQTSGLCLLMLQQQVVHIVTAAL